MITATRYHDFSAGHRVVGHESKCRHLHGHNYRVHFTCRMIPGLGTVDSIGRVIDFSVIKDKLCNWLEENWDHKFLASTDDKLMRDLLTMAANSSQREMHGEDFKIFDDSVVWVPFNPTAEMMAEYLAFRIGPQQLAGTGVELIKVTIEETAKCSASVTNLRRD